MYTFLMTLHVMACLGMILFVLLQTGRGAGLSMFGGGGDSLINTPSGSSFMKKFTAGLAATFAITSLLLTLISDRTGMASVTSRASAPVPAPAAQPAAAPQGPTSQGADEAYQQVGDKKAPAKAEAPKTPAKKK